MKWPAIFQKRRVGHSGTQLWEHFCRILPNTCSHIHPKQTWPLFLFSKVMMASSCNVLKPGKTARNTDWLILDDVGNISKFPSFTKKKHHFHRSKYLLIEGPPQPPAHRRGSPTNRRPQPGQRRHRCSGRWFCPQWSASFGGLDDGSRLPKNDVRNIMKYHIWWYTAIVLSTVNIISIHIMCYYRT